MRELASCTRPGGTVDAGARRGLLVGLAGAAAVALVLQLSGADLTTLVPRSPLGIAVTAGLVAAVVGWTALARRFIASRPLRGAVAVLPVVLLSGWLVVPLLADRTVEEGLLSGVPAAAPPVGTTTTTPGPTPTPTGMASPAAPEVVTLGTGALRGLDGYRASGTASLLEVSGTTFVRLADLDASRAPDVRVWLVPAGQEDPSAGGIDLGELKGNQGSSNYAVPAGTDVGPYGTVLLWCRAFSVPIGAADLA